MTQSMPQPSPGPAPVPVPPPRRTGPLAVLQAIVVAFHPGPTAAVTVIAVVLGLAIGLQPTRLILLALTVFTGQLSIGWSNDWIDAARDRDVGRTDKPIAAGVVSAAVVRALAFGTLVVTLLLGFTLGVAAGVVQVVFVTSAWAYNAGLKATWFSWVPYAVSFGLLPALVSLSQRSPQWPFAWVIIAGSLLGVAAHFANVLPDLLGDERTGVRGLPHRLGAAVSRLVPFVLLAGVAVLLAAGTLGTSGRLVAGRGTAGYTGQDPVGTVVWPGISAAAWPWPGLGLAAGIVLGLVVAIVGVVVARTRPATRTLMRLIMLGALVDAVMLALAGTAMVPA